jgi:transcriptional regulator with XRE-family HTH domain
MAKLGHNSGTLWLSRIYNNIDRDPEIDRFLSLSKGDRVKETDLAVLAGLSGSTVKNMFGGKTRRPQHATFAKMAGALGYKYDLVRDERPDYENAIPKAREEFKAYKALLAKNRERHGTNGKTKSRKRKAASK